MNFAQHQGFDPSRLAMLAQMRQSPQVVGANQPEVFALGAPQQQPAPQQPAQQPANVPYQARGPALGLEGFDAGKMANAQHITPKYVFGRHAQGLGVADQDELLSRLRNDGSGFFKNARWGGSKNDRLFIDGDLDTRFEGLREFDVIRAMGEGGKGWQWSAPGAPKTGASRGTGVGGAVGRLARADTGSNVLDMIRAEIDALSRSETAPTEREALISLIRGIN